MDKDAKEKLLAAAVPLFAEKGFAAVSIREVAEAAGVNSALISYYFGGKSGLYEAVLNEQFSVITVFLQSLGAQPPAEGSAGLTDQQLADLVDRLDLVCRRPADADRLGVESEHFLVPPIGSCSSGYRGTRPR